MSADPLLDRYHDNPINERYRLSSKIGEGRYGVVYRAIDEITGEEWAVKLEHVSVIPSRLTKERECYDRLLSLTPDVQWFGEVDDYRVLVCELLGPNLEDMFAYCEHKFSLKTVLNFAYNALINLEVVHLHGIIHGGVKPRDILLLSPERPALRMTNFELSQKYPPSSEVENAARMLLADEMMFASMKAHRDLPQDYYDDLESLGYLMVYFLKGELPWLGISSADLDDTNRAIMEKKMATTEEELCAGLPEEFAEYMRRVESMRGGPDPHAPIVMDESHPKYVLWQNSNQADRDELFDLSGPGYSALREMLEPLAVKMRSGPGSEYDWITRRKQEQPREQPS